MTVLFNIFRRQTLTDDFWGLHKYMNCAFPLSLRIRVKENMRIRVKENEKLEMWHSIVGIPPPPPHFIKEGGEGYNLAKIESFGGGGTKFFARKGG